jgi:hypothetical protein
MISVFNCNSPENPLVANYTVGAYSYTPLRKPKTNYAFDSSILLGYLHWQGAKVRGGKSAITETAKHSAGFSTSKALLKIISVASLHFIASSVISVVHYFSRRAA